MVVVVLMYHKGEGVLVGIDVRMYHDGDLIGRRVNTCQKRQGVLSIYL